MRYATPDASRCGGPALEDALGQVPGLLFIANNIAPRAPGGADAAVGDFHHPNTEEIGAGLHAVLPGAAAGGIPGFEADAEVEHGRGKENGRLFYSWKAPRFSAFSLAFLGKENRERKRL